MAVIKEIGRRCEVSRSSGVACGPIDMTVVNAEMKVSVNNQIRYLIVTWVQEVGDDVSFEITRESLWNYLDATCNIPNWEVDLTRIRKESEKDNSKNGKDKYIEQYLELVQLVKNKIIEEKLIDLDDYDEDEPFEWGF